MIISEKQIMNLIQMAQLYARELRLTEPELAEMVKKFIDEIFVQQSEELKVIE